VYGAIFWAVAGLMLLDLRWAILEMGVVWTAVLAGIGVDLRRLAKTG
jgi:hypothetical protein